MSRNYEYDVWNEDLQDWVLNPLLVEEYQQECAWERDVWAYRDEIAAQAEGGDEPYAGYEREVARRYHGK